MISLAGAAQQPKPNPEPIGLSADQVARIAEFAAGVRGVIRNVDGKPIENPILLIVEVPHLSRVVIAARILLPKPAKRSESEVVERLIGPDGTLYYDDLENYLERAQEAS